MLHRMNERASVPGFLRWDLRRKLCRALVLGLLSTPALAQVSANLLGNSGFENNPPPSLGNNIGYSVLPWVIGGGAPPNVVKVNGSTSYGSSGPQLDAEGTPTGTAQHYLDITNGNNYVYQTFKVPTCGSTDASPRTVTFSGYFSGRDNSLNANGLVAIVEGTPVFTNVSTGTLGGTVLAQVSGANMASVPSMTQSWNRLSGTVQVTPGSTISYVAWLSDYANFDNASLAFSNFTCPSTTLTLQKTWSSSVAGHMATITATRDGSQVDSLTSTATGAANQTTTDVTPLTVFAGDTITLAETTTPGTYYKALSCSGDVTVSGNTVTVGSLSGTPAPIVCTYTNSLTAKPSLAVTKTAAVADTNGDLVTGDVGDVVTYSFTVTNNGNVPLTGVSITDPLPGLSALSLTWPDPANAGALAVNATATAAATYTLKAADVTAGKVDNTATATASPAGGVSVPSASASATVTTYATPVPSLTVTKSAAVADTNGDLVTGDAGDLVTYTFQVTNSGNVGLTGVSIADPLIGLSALTITWPDAANPGALAVGASATATATYTLTAADAAAGKVNNTATATANPVGSISVPPASGSANVATFPTPAPSLSLAKSATVADTNGDQVKGNAGDVVTYTIAVTNNGNVALSGVSIADPLAGLSALTITWPDAANPGALAIGASATATATYKLTAADVTAGKVNNTATASANAVGSIAVPSVSGSATVPTSDAVPTPAPVPVDNPWALAMLAAGLAWFGRRAKRAGSR